MLADSPPLHVELDALAELAFPGRAGELQRSRDLDAFADELGRRYDDYNAFLNQQLIELEDPNPDAAAYRERYGLEEGLTRFTAAMSQLQRLLRAEELLRDARAATQAGKRFDEADPHNTNRDDEAPVLIDGRIAHADEPRPAGERPQDTRRTPMAAELTEFLSHKLPNRPPAPPAVGR